MQRQRQTTTYAQTPVAPQLGGGGGGGAAPSGTPAMATKQRTTTWTGTSYILAVAIASFIAYLFPDDVVQSIVENIKLSGVPLGSLADPRVSLSYFVLIVFWMLLESLFQELGRARANNYPLLVKINPLGLNITKSEKVEGGIVDFGTVFPMAPSNAFRWFVAIIFLLSTLLQLLVQLILFLILLGTKPNHFIELL